MSEKGLEHRSKRPIEVEAFLVNKSNNRFNRFTMKVRKVTLGFYYGRQTLGKECNTS
ncbi:MAG: hypothetical protein R2790_06285 [Flavobacterium haoranii]